MCGKQCNYCYNVNTGRDRSVWLTLISTLVVISAWPLISAFQIRDFPYPLTLTMIVQMIIMLIGLVLFGFEMCIRGVICCPNRTGVEEYEEPSIDEEGEEKGPLSLKTICKRLLHWSMFSGLFLTIFVYASTIAQAPCRDSPNLCTILFRACLFLTAVMSLALINSERRGGRLDWFVGLILAVGICLLLWSHQDTYVIDFQKETSVIIGGALVLLSFSVILISLRRGVQGSSIAKTVWVQSFYGFITMVGLAAFFEGAAPWDAFFAQGFGVAWRVLAVIGICIVWLWFTVMSLAFSETIIVALAMQFSLLLGDMGVHAYIFAEWTFTGSFLVGLAFVLIGFLWLLKRVVMLNCPDLCGKWCNWGTGEEEFSDEDLGLIDHSDEDPESKKPGYRQKVAKKYGEQYLDKYKKEQSYGTMPPKKKKNPW